MWKYLKASHDQRKHFSTVNSVLNYHTCSVNISQANDIYDATSKEPKKKVFFSDKTGRSDADLLCPRTGYLSGFSPLDLALARSMFTGFTALNLTKLYCITLYHYILHCNIPQLSAVKCSVLQYSKQYLV